MTKVKKTNHPIFIKYGVSVLQLFWNISHNLEICFMCKRDFYRFNTQSTRFTCFQYS